MAEPVKKYYQPYLQKFVVLSVRKPLLSRKQKNSLWKQFPFISTVNIFFITDKQLLHSWSSQHARGKSKIRLNYCSSLQYLKRSHLFYLWRFFFNHPKHVEEAGKWAEVWHVCNETKKEMQYSPICETFPCAPFVDCHLKKTGEDARINKNYANKQVKSSLKKFLLFSKSVQTSRKKWKK